jgi:hypothetical protein
MFLMVQVNFKKSTMSEHVTHLETLREEINIMTEKKMDLERRIEVRKLFTINNICILINKCYF